MSEVHIHLSNRIRLASAVLAAGGWPEHERALVGNGAVHPQAEATRQYVQDYAEHPAVQYVNGLLPDALDLSDLFSTAVRCAWPTLEPVEALPGRFANGEWAGLLGDFYVETALAAFFWADHEEVWAEAAGDLERIFPDDALVTLLTSLSGQAESPDVAIVPNLVFPTMHTVVAHNAQTHFVIVPPTVAKGEALPRTYRDGAGWIQAEVCYALLPYFLADVLAKLTPAQARLLRYAVTAAFVESVSSDEAAALFYRLHCKNEAGLEQIDLAVDVVRRYLAQPDAHELAGLFSAGVPERTA